MIEVSLCPSCSGTFVPTRPVCPRCGVPTRREERPPTGRILCATELFSPAEGWSSPHRLALVELEEGGRLLVRVPGPPPQSGERGILSRDEQGRWVWIASDLSEGT
jgi:uncharacterized OB-fold protein